MTIRASGSKNWKKGKFLQSDMKKKSRILELLLRELKIATTTVKFEVQNSVGWVSLTLKSLKASKKFTWG